MYIQAQAPIGFYAPQTSFNRVSTLSSPSVAAYTSDRLILNAPPVPPATDKPPPSSNGWTPAMKIALISAPVAAGLGIGIARGGAMGGLIGTAIGAAVSVVGLWWHMTVSPFD